MEILRNPIVKTVGICLIIYFALFSNKKNPESLGNRLSAKNVKDGFNEITQKAHLIAGKVSTANQQNEELERMQQKKFRSAEADYKEIKEGEGDAISCGDYAFVRYRVLNSSGEELGKISEGITIGSLKKLVIEKNIIGMKRGGTRLITASENSQTLDQKTKSQIAQSGGRMSFEVMLENFDKIPNKPISCQ